VSPLDKLQAEAENRYELELEQYESDLESWEAQSKGDRDAKPKPPLPTELYLSDFTLEALAAVLGNQRQRGLLISIDELARFFSSMDAYRGGKGGDRQHWLSLYDGGAFKCNRKGTGRVYAGKTSISVLGGIQPSVLQRIWSEDLSSEDGLWSRFTWVKIPITASPGIQEGVSYNLSGLLQGLYQCLRELPAATYRLTADAVKVWNHWHSEIEQAILREPSGLLRAAYPKARERAARIALVIHLVEAAISQQVPSRDIPAITLANAIQFSRWLIGQTRLLYAEFGIVDNPETAKILKFVNRFRGCGWIDSSTVRGWWSGVKKPTRQECRDFMALVVSTGHACDNDIPPTEAGYKIQILGNPSPLSPSQTQMLTEQEIQRGLITSPNLVPLVPLKCPLSKLLTVRGLKGLRN
jgi:hypothetical protein